ncbi:phospholipase/carboxylesterase [Roseimicrobium gellanilyticum]|uniref:Phospholipase/carboxylesterase n=1 Tax=Roseimicrobium gellanilyticum TaxID=748857 RepID=A0A366HTB0_9BACT|nr:alpha/beta hydrolase-fold protein [Roseimicrobium gellanilyticum]RBP46489.1 phospholipase/carboxylesterase [Roseimicrobium gellanilyticum]
MARLPLPPASLRLLLCLFLGAFAIPNALAEKAEPFVFVPSKGEGPFPVALWLHGYRGYSPSGYFPGESAEAMQKHADALGAVIVGFPATTELGDDTQQWSEEPVADHAYVQERLRSLKTPAKLDLNRVGLFGFSQGAMVAAALATVYPENYLGAILMSPGGMSNPKGSNIKLPLHAKQVYYCFCGAAEQEGNVMLTKGYAEHFEKVLGAKVTLKLYEGVSKHTRPADFMEKFPEWMGAILKSRE